MDTSVFWASNMVIRPVFWGGESGEEQKKNDTQRERMNDK